MRALTEATILALHSLHVMMLKNGAVSASEVSRSSGFPLHRIQQVAGKLRDAGLIRSSPGRGFVLARAPGEITIQDIVRAVDEPQPPTAPCGGDYDACASRASCILAPLCRSAEDSQQKVLRSFTLAELLGIRPDLPNCMDPKLEAS